MKSKEYFPRNEAAVSQWCDSFKEQFAAQAAALGFGETEVQAVNDTCVGISTAISEANAARTTYEEKVSVKKAVMDTNTGAIREMVRRIKASPSYTEAIGKTLGIVGEGSSFDPTTAVPKITLVKSATGYDFKFALLGYFDAVAVFRRKPGETEFARVDVDMKSPYSIPSPTENGVEYYFQYMKNDRLIGRPSDIIAVKL